MPEVIDQVRRHVAVAADANPEAIRWRVEAIVGPVPATRRKPDLGGQKAEQESRISNLFPIPPTSVTFGGSQTSIKVGISGAELKTGKGALKVTAGKEGAEAELKGNGAKVAVSGKWDGSEFALKTEVGGVKFESKVHHKGDGWGWSGGLVIPLSGEEVDELPDVSAAVGGAHNAIAESLGYLQGGGSLTDGFVTGRMAQVKPAIDAAKNISGRTKPGATLRVTGSADSTGWTAGVSPGDRLLARYRCAWSFQVIRCQPSKSMPSMRRLRRSNTVMPVLAWPAYQSGTRCSGPNASPNSARPRKKWMKP